VTRPKIEEAADCLIRELAVALRLLKTCPGAADLRQPPSLGLASDLVWATAVEGLIQWAGGQLRTPVAATSWLPHTIRGAMAGALKKKLGLTVTSEKVEGRGRVYRVQAA